MKMILYGGVEGGASNSRIVVLDQSGSLIASAEGPPTNQWLIGMEEAVRRLAQLINDAMKSADVREDYQLHLCLALSGVDTDENKRDLINALSAIKPELAKRINICNDTIGTYLTVTNEPALVLISGTGSICKYIRKDLTFERTGGYGYLLGDGGSAYWISHQIILKFLEFEDGLIEANEDIGPVRRIIYEHFQIKSSDGLLPAFYNNFSKNHVARLCERIVIEASTGNRLCSQVVHDAGVQLGRHVVGTLSRVAKEIPPTLEELVVICCGKVFLSWKLLRSGFCEALKDSVPRLKWSGRLKLVRLLLSAGYGAARLAARLGTGVEIPIPKDAVENLDFVDLSSL